MDDPAAIGGMDEPPRTESAIPGWPPSPPAGAGYPPPPPGGPTYGPAAAAAPGYRPMPYRVPPGWTSSDDRTWAMLSHLSFFALGIIGPIIIMLTKGKESQFVRHQAVEALNFHITVFLATIVSIILFLVVIGIVLLLAVIVCGVVFTIMGAVAANNGTAYRYPLNLRFVH